jgi:GrpB-like predicted nucleotidyltransferase (UPF0157 family)
VADREPVTEELLDRVLVGPRDRTPRRIELADPDPAWPVRFEEHRARVAAALGERALQVEHVGSTSVPGLRAKPVVDVLVAVPDPEDPDVVARLEAAGYALRVREPGHRMLVPADPAAPRAHVHVWAAGDPEVERVLLFRDRLRADDGDRARYQARKEELADRLWTDANYYAEAKSAVVEEVVARARAAAHRPG